MDTNLINPGERLDDLQIDNLKLIQNPEWFCFGVDAVLLSDFASKSIKKGSYTVDFCTGNGIIPILLTSKTDGKYFTGIEIQECVSELASRNVAYNNLGEKIKIICGDLCTADSIIQKSTVDYITCNPPYKKCGSGLKNENDIITIARHEVLCNLESIIFSAEKLLKPGGKLL